MKIVADEKIPFLSGVFEPYADVCYLSGEKISNNDVKDADALIVRTRTKCNAALLQGTKVKLITSATIGYDHIDTKYCAANNIEWYNAPGCNSEGVAQYVTASLLHFAVIQNIDLSEKTIGIVGVGNVGKKIANKSKALGMCVLLNDPPRKRNENLQNFVSLNTILKQSDIVTFHVPLTHSGTDKTKHLIDKQLIKNLKTGAILINTSRGEVADTYALLKAISDKQLGGIVLDVWENEPKLNIDLLRQVDIGTPHIAGYSTDGKARATEICIENVCRFFQIDIQKPVIGKLPTAGDMSIELEEQHYYKAINKAVCSTYNITDDGNALKNAPQSFELLRNNYRIRREFDAYTIYNNKEYNNISNVLKQLGFGISQNQC